MKKKKSGILYVIFYISLTFNTDYHRWNAKKKTTTTTE